ncbi:MAG: RdgB/HAM1 family non-canonical purine NTP pyrophosphatase [Rectinema sp.]|jgi:XTP/dITP diphosphohydrolase|uniref:dITP/XTP pyrophosphatase n=1 Tax=uncultured spirochete TaxID=156406 RepID=A0A3P3XT54_9SPIR|nr:Non-canonical purine NTP pyrophosphatase [uncultured spirochete]
MKLLVATNNLHKLEELKPLFSEHELLRPIDLGIHDFNPEENGRTFFENAFIKAEALYHLAGRPVIADDSGLCVEALHGRPGIESARYGSNNGRLLSAAEKNSLLLSELENMKNRHCVFVCCLVLYYGPQRFLCVQETLEGEIGMAPRGDRGFGYDPIVYLPRKAKTVAELSQEEKNRISHRGKAAQKMAAILGITPIEGTV